jgi:hypothetical protein
VLNALQFTNSQSILADNSMIKGYTMVSPFFWDRGYLFVILKSVGLVQKWILYRSVKRIGPELPEKGAALVAPTHTGRFMDVVLAYVASDNWKRKNRYMTVAWAGFIRSRWLLQQLHMFPLENQFTGEDGGRKRAEAKEQLRLMSEYLSGELRDADGLLMSREHKALVLFPSGKCGIGRFENPWRFGITKIIAEVMRQSDIDVFIYLVPISYSNYLNHIHSEVEVHTCLVRLSDNWRKFFRENEREARSELLRQLENRARELVTWHQPITPPFSEMLSAIRDEIFCTNRENIPEVAHELSETATLNPDVSITDNSISDEPKAPPAVQCETFALPVDVVRVKQLVGTEEWSSFSKVMRTALPDSPNPQIEKLYDRLQREVEAIVTLHEDMLGAIFAEDEPRVLARFKRIEQFMIAQNWVLPVSLREKLEEYESIMSDLDLPYGCEINKPDIILLFLLPLASVGGVVYGPLTVIRMVFTRFKDQPKIRRPGFQLQYRGEDALFQMLAGWSILYALLFVSTTVLGIFHDQPLLSIHFDGGWLSFQGAVAYASALLAATFVSCVTAFKTGWRYKLLLMSLARFPSLIRAWELRDEIREDSRMLGLTFAPHSSGQFGCASDGEIVCEII